MQSIKEKYDLKAFEKITLRGDFATKTVWLNNKELSPEFCKSIYDHLSKGFDWGNPGPGTAQLALTILFELTDDKRISMILHHVFKNEILMRLPALDFEIVVNLSYLFSKYVNYII